MHRFEFHHADGFQTLAAVKAAGVPYTLCFDPPYGIALSNHSRPGDGSYRKGKWNCPADDCEQSRDRFQDLIGAELAAGTPTIVFCSPWRPWAGKWRNMIVWDKGECVGGGGDTATCLKRTWELILVGNNRPFNGRRDGSVLGGFPVAQRDYHFHPNAKPVELMRYLIEKFTRPGELVVDITMGSGSTGLACIAAGRAFVGSENDPDYFEVARRRFAAARMRNPLIESALSDI